MARCGNGKAAWSRSSPKKIKRGGESIMLNFIKRVLFSQRGTASADNAQQSGRRGKLQHCTKRDFRNLPVANPQLRHAGLYQRVVWRGAEMGRRRGRDHRQRKLREGVNQ